MTRDELEIALIDALRSGKYRQAQNVMLSHGGARCCLGVAADILRLPVVATDQFDGPVCVAVNRDTYRALEAAGLDGPTLGNMNDGGRTFRQIADWLEADREARGAKVEEPE